MPLLLLLPDDARRRRGVGLVSDEYVFDLANYRAHEGETPRDILIALLDQHGCCVADGDAEKLVDAFADELADKVRALVPDVAKMSAGQKFKDAYAAALLVAAQEIGPEETT